MPKVIVNDIGCIIEANNLFTSVGWRNKNEKAWNIYTCLLYTSPSPRDTAISRMPSSA